MTKATPEHSCLEMYHGISQILLVLWKSDIATYPRAVKAHHHHRENRGLGTVWTGLVTIVTVVTPHLPSGCGGSSSSSGKPRSRDCVDWSGYYSDSGNTPLTLGLWRLIIIIGKTEV